MSNLRSPQGYVDTGNPDSAASTRITFADSPYTIRAKDQNLFCNTTNGVIVVNLLAGAQGQGHRIINTGTVSNRVILNPNETDLLLGLNSSIDILDHDVAIIAFDRTEGWW